MDNKTLITIAIVAVVAVVIGAAAGYSLKAAPEKAPVDCRNTTIPVDGGRIHVYDMSANGTTINITKGTEFVIALPENGGSTGYLWNITSTQGLDILGSWFIPGEKGLIGEPGVREYAVRASWAGEQKFKATLQRSFEAPAGNETVFLLAMNVSG